MSDSLWPRGLYSPWNSPGHNTGEGSFSFLQGIFPTHGSNPGLLHCRWILYQLSHQGSPKILEWVAYPFPSKSSQPRNQTRISCIAGRFFTNWAIKEVLSLVETGASHWQSRSTNRVFFFFNWRIIALKYVLVSAIHKHESAIGIHMVPSLLNLPPTSVPIPLL